MLPEEFLYTFFIGTIRYVMKRKLVQNFGSSWFLKDNVITSIRFTHTKNEHPEYCLCCKEEKKPHLNGNTVNAYSNFDLFRLDIRSRFSLFNLL